MKINFPSHISTSIIMHWTHVNAGIPTCRHAEIASSFLLCRKAVSISYTTYMCWLSGLPKQYPGFLCHKYLSCIRPAEEEFLLVKWSCSFSQVAVHYQKHRARGTMVKHKWWNHHCSYSRKKIHFGGAGTICYYLYNGTSYNLAAKTTL